MFVRVISHTSKLAVFLGVTALALAAPAARAQHRVLPPNYCPPPTTQPCPPAAQAPTSPPGSTQPGQTQTPATPAAPDTAAQPPALPSEQAAAAGGETVAFATPSMIGDLGFGSSVRGIFRSPNGATFNAILPVQARGAFKIAENESPRPQNRVFFTYNYFNNLNGDLNPPGFPRLDLHREVIGFEKIIDNRDASIGMRLPFLQLDSNGEVYDRDIGDLSVILKYAFINDCSTGNVASAGLVATFPTGGSTTYTLSDGSGGKIHPTILQPWAGFIYNFDDFFVQGFTSVAIPTDDRDVSLWFNDLAIGWVAWRAADSRNRPSNAFRDCLPGGDWPDPTTNAFGASCAPCCCGTYFLTALVPTLECHINTPLNHRSKESITDPVLGIDTVVITAGVHAVFLNKATLLIGAATPISGPQPFDLEAVVQFNVRF